MASKAFRATLPSLNETQLEQLQNWIAANCASGAVFQEDGCTFLLATRERAKTQEAFLRSVRSTLKRFNIDMSKVRRRWLSLTTEDVVDAEVAARNRSAKPPIAALLGDMETSNKSADTPEEGDRIIALPSAARRNPVPG